MKVTLNQIKDVEKGKDIIKMEMFIKEIGKMI